MSKPVGYRGRMGLIGMVASVTALSLTAPAAAGSTGSLFDDDAHFDLPSGQEVTFLDVIEGEDSAAGSAIRVRFLAPQIARDRGEVDFVAAEEDMVVLCQDHVLPRMVDKGVAIPSQIIIVLSDRVVEYGMADPEATQFFEAYRPDGAMCVWEGF